MKRVAVAVLVALGALTAEAGSVFAAIYARIAGSDDRAAAADQRVVSVRGDGDETLTTPRRPPSFPV